MKILLSIIIKILSSCMKFKLYVDIDTTGKPTCLAATPPPKAPVRIRYLIRKTFPMIPSSRDDVLASLALVVYTITCGTNIFGR